MVAVVTFDSLFRDRIDINRTVGANIDACGMTTAQVIVDRYGSSRLFVECTPGTGFYTGSVLTMLTGHRKKHSSDLGILAHVLVKSLTNEMSQRHIILGLTAHFARMTSKTTSCVYKPSVVFSIIWRLHAILPKGFRLKPVF